MIIYKTEIMSNDETEYTDLIKRYEDDKDIEVGVSKLNLSSEHIKYKIGQEITFMAGYHGNIKYKSRITGFDADGDIYVLWDCYWSPIRDEPKREIQILTK